MSQFTIKKTEKGYGVFAAADIRAGEIIALFDGAIYEADYAMELPAVIRDYVIQFAPTYYRHSNSFAHMLNHSCEPNCGIGGLFEITAMRNIAKGEELTWDYEMSENSDWRMECLCGARNCRRIIGSFSELPMAQKKAYGELISDWLK